METSARPTDQRIVFLLTAILVLLVVMLGGIGIGASLAWREYAQIRKALGTRDTVVALLEDAVAVGGCLWIVSRSL